MIELRTGLFVVATVHAGQRDLRLGPAAVRVVAESVTAAMGRIDGDGG
jgi:hypothetical protein